MIKILRGQEITCKPFKKHHEEQLKLVSSFNWLDLDKLNDVQTLITETFSGGEIEDYIDERRVRAIGDSVERRVEHLAQLIQTQNPMREDSTEDDVEENIAEDYGPKMTM